MFSWVKERKLRRRRELFHFWDGEKHRSVDPLKTWRLIHSDEEFRADVHPQLADQGDEESLGILLRAVQRAFGVVDYSQDRMQGLTQAEQITLYVGFCAYLDGIKKNINLSPTSPAATEQTSKESSDPITNGSSLCGSGCQEPSTEQPTSSGSGSTPPSG